MLLELIQLLFCGSLLILFVLFMTPLQLLDFQKLQTISSHFDSVFRRFHEQITITRYLFTNFLPLSPNENGAPTFLQWSH